MNAPQSRLTALALTLLLPLTACGGNDEPIGPAPRSAPPPSTATPTTAPASPPGSAAPAAPSAQPSVISTLTDCLRRQGIEVPPAGEKWTPPPGYDPAKAQKALTSCLPKTTPPRR